MSLNMVRPINFFNTACGLYLIYYSQLYDCCLKHANLFARILNLQNFMAAVSKFSHSVINDVKLNLCNFY